MYNLFNRILKTRSIIFSYKAYPNFYKLSFNSTTKLKYTYFYL